MFIAKYAVKIPAIARGSVNNKYFTLTEDIKYAKRSPKTYSNPGNEDGIDLFTLINNNPKNRQIKLSKLGQLVTIGCIVDDIKLKNIGYFKNSKDEIRLGLFDSSLAKVEKYEIAFKYITIAKCFKDLMLSLNQQLNFNGTLIRDQQSFIKNTIRDNSIFNIYDNELTVLIIKHTKRSDFIEHIKEGAFLVAFLKIFNAQDKLITDLNTVTDFEFEQLTKTIAFFVKELCNKYQKLAKQWYNNKLQKDKTYLEVLANINKVSTNEDNNWINDVTTNLCKLEQIANS